MMRVLTLATLYPSAAQPNLGLFVERQTRGLAAMPVVELEVVSPVGLPLWPLARHPHYAPRAALPVEEEWNGLKVHRPRFRVWPRVGEAGAARAMAEAVLPVARAFRPDVIDAQFFWPDGPAAAILAKALGIPFSVKARGADIHFWGARPGIDEQIAAAGRAASGLLAVSGAMKADMVRLGMPEERIAIHHTGVDLGLFAPVDRAAAKAALGVAGPLLVTAGALIPRKGQEIAIRALELLPDATLLLAGEGPDRPMLEALARPLGSRIRFLGARPQADVARFLAAADVAVQPSSSEGLANVWVEALASGTPVVTTDVGGALEAIDRPAAGRLVPRDPHAVATAVRDLLAAPPSQDEVRAAAARFSWERNAQELLLHLRGIAQRADAADSPAGRNADESACAARSRRRVA